MAHALNRSFTLFILLAALVLTTGTSAQTTEDDGEAYIAVVTEDEVLVRSGAADSYYPFARLKSGDLISVVGGKFNWSRVQTIGPAFEGLYGYIKYPKSETGRFRIGPDGKTGTTMGLTDVLAPNLDAGGDPKGSWKPIVRLQAERSVHVLETTETERETIHKIKLPEQAIGWVSTPFLRKATASEVAAWEVALAAQKEQPKKAAAPKKETNIIEDVAQGTFDAATGAAESVARGVTDIAEGVTDQVLGREEPKLPDAEQPRTASRAPSVQPSLPDTTAIDTMDEPQGSPIETNSPTKLTMGDDGRTTDQPASMDDVPEKGSVGHEIARTEPKELLESLEQAYEMLLKEDIGTAELEPLRELYLSLAARTTDSDKSISQYAGARAEQLRLWGELQQRRQKIAQIQDRTKFSAEEATSVYRAAEASGEYVAVGRLSVSTIYDGTNLPQLFRLQDPGTGRTLAYLEPNPDLHLRTLLGQLIGVVGTKDYDGGLRLTLIVPRRIDILAPQQEQQ